MLPTRFVIRLAALLLACAAHSVFAQPSPTRNAAGTIDWLVGSVQITAPASAASSGAPSQRTAKTGDTLYEGDAMSTGAKSEVHLNMADGGFMALRESTQLVVSKYQANGDSSDASVMRLLQGALRSVTGWIGKTSPKNYSIRTATATIGVRGTEHETVVIVDGDVSEQGTYDRVYEGATLLTTDDGSIEIGRGKAGFVPDAAQADGASSTGGAQTLQRRRPRLLGQVPVRVFARGQRDAHFVGLHARLAARTLKRRELRREAVRLERAARAEQRRGAAAPYKQRAYGQPEAAPSQATTLPAPRQAGETAPQQGGQRELREQRMAERERRQALRQQQQATQPN